MVVLTLASFEIATLSTHTWTSLSSSYGKCPRLPLTSPWNCGSAGTFNSPYSNETWSIGALKSLLLRNVSNSMPWRSTLATMVSHICRKKNCCSGAEKSRTAAKKMFPEEMLRKIRNSGRRRRLIYFRAVLGGGDRSRKRTALSDLALSCSVLSGWIISGGIPNFGTSASKSLMKLSMFCGFPLMFEQSEMWCVRTMVLLLMLKRP